MTEKDKIKPVRAFLWGTGDYAKRVMHRIAYVNNALKDILPEGFYRIIKVIDSDPQKYGARFGQWRIIQPQMADWNEAETIIAAAENHTKIDSYIHKTGGNHIVYYWEDIDAEKPARLQIKGLLRAYGLPYQKEIDLKTVQNPYMRKLLEITIFLQMREAIAEEQSRQKQYCSLFGIDHFLGALYYIFRGQIKDVFPLHLSNPKKKAQTGVLAFYYPKLSNGGTERVVSLLLQQFAERTDYRLLFICNEAGTESDYMLPQSVERIVLSNAPEQDAWRWLEEWNKTLNGYAVNILVSHDTFNFMNFYLGGLCRYNGIRFVIVNHNAVSLSEKNYSNLLRVFQSADAMVVLSKAAGSYWKERGVRGCYIPNPVEQSESAGSNAVRERNRILWIGRINQKQKNVMAVVPIMKHIVKENRDAVLEIVGKEDEEGLQNRLEQQIIKNHLENNIIFSGYHTDVIDFYRRASVLLMTSFYEGFPMTIIESKRQGLPMALFELPDIELLIDGRGYVSVKQGDEKAMADAVLRILKDDVLRERMSRQAEESLKPFMEYDVIRAWQSLFHEIDL